MSGNDAQPGHCEASISSSETVALSEGHTPVPQSSLSSTGHQSQFAAGKTVFAPHMYVSFMPQDQTHRNHDHARFRHELDQFRTARAGYLPFADISKRLHKDVAVTPDTVANIFHGTSLSRWSVVDAIIEILLVEAKIDESQHSSIVEHFRELWSAAKSPDSDVTSTTMLTPIAPKRTVRDLEGPTEITTVMLTRDLVTQLDQQIGTDILGLLPPGTALLVVKRGPTAGSRFLLDEPQVTAGRHPDSDIFLDDSTISRRHATFTRTPDNRWLVSDNDSLNKVYVNRVAVDEHLLRTGDEIQLGKFRLVHLEPRIWTELSDTAKVNIVDLEEHPL